MTVQNLIWDGNGQTVSDGTAASTANTGASTSANISAFSFALSKGIGGRLGLRVNGPTVQSNIRRTLTTPGSTFRFAFTFALPLNVPTLASQTANLSVIRTSGPGVRFAYTNLGHLQLQDAANLAGNQLDVGAVSPGQFIWWEVWGVVGTTTSNTEIHTRAWDRFTGVPIGVQKDSTVYNMGTGTTTSVDFGPYYAVTTDHHDFGIAEAQYESGVNASFGGPPPVVWANNAEGLPSGAVTTTAQTQVNALSAIDVSQLNGCTLAVDVAAGDPAHGTAAWKLSIPANGNGYMAVPANSAQYVRFRATKKITIIPTVSERIFSLQNTAGGRAAYGYITSAAKVRFDNASTTLGSSGASVLVNQQVTFEGYVSTGSTTAGTLHLRAYKNNDPAQIIYEQAFDAGTDTGTSNIASLMLGRGVAIADAEDSIWDDIQLESSATTPFTDYIGPAAGGTSSADGSVAAVKASSTAASVEPIVSVATTLSGSGPATANAFMNAPAITAVTNVTVQAVKGISTTFAVAPVVLGVQNVAISPLAATGTFSMRLPQIANNSSAGITTVVSTSTSLARVPTVTATRAGAVTAVVATSTSLVRAPAVAGSRSVNVAVDVVSMAISMTAPAVALGPSIQAVPANAQVYMLAPGVATGISILYGRIDYSKVTLKGYWNGTTLVPVHYVTTT